MISTSRQPSQHRMLPVVTLVLAALLAPVVTKAQTVAPPESVGMSSDRLARLTASFRKEVDDKKLPGAVMMVTRKGKLAYATAVGVRDPKSADPMQTDTIFRIYSMTKPMVSVAAMVLVEDGGLQLGDPVSHWLPPFKVV